MLGMTIPIHLADGPLGYEACAIEKRVGLILLATDHITEADFARLVTAESTGVFSTRIVYANPVTVENLRALAPRLTEAAALILPDEKLDVVCFSCTAASVEIGDDVIAAAIQRAKPGVPVVTLTIASVAGLRALSARRISLLTPYTTKTSELIADYFAAKDFSIESVTCLGLDDDRQIAQLSRDTKIEKAVAAMSRAADALFISCTALRSASVVAKIEARIGRPVITSNQASAWACLEYCHIPAPSLAAGRLFAQAT